MRKGEASRTAAYMALFRALEFTLPAGQRLFEDQFASAFLPLRLRFVAHLSRIHLAGALVRAYIDRQWPGARTSAVARTKFIDNAAEEALRAGIGQVVILGAGFDTFALRQPGWARALHILEVDHAGTQTAKLGRMGRAGLAMPANVLLIAQ